MTDKKKTDQQAAPKDMPARDTSSNAERARLLAHLRQQGSINTFEAIRLPSRVHQLLMLVLGLEVLRWAL